MAFKKWLFLFKKELEFRKKIHGIPLPYIQKIKAARKISHIKYPYHKGYTGLKGHIIRDKFRRKLLKSIGVNYKLKL